MFNTSVMCFQVANIVHLATCMVVSPLLQYECSKSKHIMESVSGSVWFSVVIVERQCKSGEVVRSMIMLTNLLLSRMIEGWSIPSVMKSTECLAYYNEGSLNVGTNSKRILTATCTFTVLRVCALTTVTRLRRVLWRVEVLVIGRRVPWRVASSIFREFPI